MDQLDNGKNKLCSNPVTYNSEGVGSRRSVGLRVQGMLQRCWLIEDGRLPSNVGLECWVKQVESLGIGRRIRWRVFNKAGIGDSGNRFGQIQPHLLGGLWLGNRAGESGGHSTACRSVLLLSSSSCSIIWNDVPSCPGFFIHGHLTAEKHKACLPVLAATELCFAAGPVKKGTGTTSKVVENWLLK